MTKQTKRDLMAIKNKTAETASNVLHANANAKLVKKRNCQLAAVSTLGIGGIISLVFYNHFKVEKAIKDMNVYMATASAEIESARRIINDSICGTYVSDNSTNFEEV